MDFEALSPIAREAFLRSIAPAAASSVALPLPFNHRLPIKKHLAEVRFGVTFETDDEFDEFFSHDRPDRSNVINRDLMELVGMGVDGFMLPNTQAPDMAYELSTTLTDIDRVLQAERTRDMGEEEEDTGDGTYVPRMHCLRARWVEGGELVYGFLYTVAEWLTEAMEDAQEKVIDRLLPMGEHPRYGAWETVVSHQLRVACYRAMNAIIDDERPRIEAGEAWVARYDFSDDVERQHTFVFSNRAAVDGVRIGGFTDDVARLPEGIERVRDLERAVVARYVAAVEDIAELVISEARIGQMIEEAAGRYRYNLRFT